MKKYFKKFEIYLVNYFSSFVIALIVCIICSIPVRFIRTLNSGMGDFIVSIIITVISLFVMSYNEGYRHREFQLKLIFISIIFLLCSQIILVLIIGHAAYITGPTIHLAYYIKPEFIRGNEPLKNLNTNLMILAFLIIYSPIMVLGEYIGVRKHRKDFANKRKKL